MRGEQVWETDEFELSSPTYEQHKKPHALTRPQTWISIINSIIWLPLKHFNYAKILIVPHHWWKISQPQSMMWEECDEATLVHDVHLTMLFEHLEIDFIWDSWAYPHGSFGGGQWEVCRREQHASLSYGTRTQTEAASSHRQTLRKHLHHTVLTLLRAALTEVDSC